MEMNFVATVLKCAPINKAADVFLIKLKLEKDVDFSCAPGQFVVLEPCKGQSVMPRPFSIADYSKGVLSIIVKAVGKNTIAYSKLAKGGKVRIGGPLGEAVYVDEQASSYILVGGGVGAAALVFLAKELCGKGKEVSVYLGFGKESEVFGEDLFEEAGARVFVIAEQGGGRRGLVTDILVCALAYNARNVEIIACGPKPMLAAVASIAEEKRLKCSLMLEEVMACGMGACLGCAVFGKDGTVKHVCKDGPAIDAEWIDMDKFLAKPPAKAGRVRHTDVSTSIRIGHKLAMSYPVFNASGCLSIDAIEKGHADISHLGALVTKGVTMEQRNGNPMPRACETPSGMINSIGLENVGIDRFISDELPRWLCLGKPVIVNISGFSVAEFIELTERLEWTDIAGFEVNISCPNVKQGGIAFGISPQMAAAVTRSVVMCTNKLVIVKLTPNVTDIVSVGRAVDEAGADAVSLINTVLAMSIDPLTRRPRIKNVMGGLSGPAVRPIAVRMVRQLYEAKLGIPIIGMGGIDSAFAAAEFIMAGASAVAVGTGAFAKRDVCQEIDSGLRELMLRHGFSSVGEMVGSMIGD